MHFADRPRLRRYFLHDAYFSLSPHKLSSCTLCFLFRTEYRRSAPFKAPHSKDEEEQWDRKGFVNNHVLVGGPLGLSSDLFFLIVENKTKRKTSENIKKMVMTTHNSQPWITLIHVLANVIFYYEKFILYNLDHNYI